MEQSKSIDTLDTYHTPIGICEDVPVVVANVTILTDFVILDIPKDDNM